MVIIACERRLDRPLRIREERGDAGQRLVCLGIEDVQYRTDEQRVDWSSPNGSACRAIPSGIDQHVGDVLHVTHLPHSPRRTSSSGL